MSEKEETGLQELAGAPHMHVPADILQFFKYDHLSEPLKAVSKPFCELAALMDKTLPDNLEKRVGLRKLLEAKDCAVRAVIHKWEGGL